MFSPTEAIKFGWGIVKKRWAFFLALFIVQTIVGNPDYLYGLATGQTTKNYDLVYHLLTLIGVALSLSMAVGMVKITLKLADNREAKLSDLFSKDIKLILKLVAVGIISGIIVLLGIILLIVPGIIFSMRLMFVGYFLIDKNLGPIEAIKASWNATRGNVWNLLGLAGLNFLVILVGALALFVGLIWAIPTVTMASVYVYKKLSSKRAS